MNLTINNNKNNVLYNNLSYNNIYFIEGNLRNIRNVITTNNSRLNIRNNKKSLIYSYKNINDLNLKKNINYKPKFKINSKVEIV